MLNDLRADRNGIRIAIESLRLEANLTQLAKIGNETAWLVDKMPCGTSLQVETESRTYNLKVLGTGEVLISGHPRHCPQPVLARLSPAHEASRGYCLSAGTSLRYYHPRHGLIRTSPIKTVSEVACAE